MSEVPQPDLCATGPDIEDFASGAVDRYIERVHGPNPYDVTIAHGLNADIAACVADTDAQRVMIIHQPVLAEAARTLADSLEDIEATCVEIPDAEDGKTLQVCGMLWDKCAEIGMTRRDIVIGLGGGAVTDLAGFVAASWMRGVRVIQVPTTLLAMVDAAVGGKTGINTAAGKNLVGAFHEPHAVFIDLDRLATLPKAEIIAGSAEIIKTGFIADPAILDRYEEDPEACLQPTGFLSFLPELIARSVAVKSRVVGQDLKESGLREILNYGHTFGHAIEQVENFRWRHGRAVAVGMMFIAELSRVSGLVDEQFVERHRRILESIGLPTSYEPDRFDELYAAMTRDKKNRAGMLRFVALEGVGKTLRLEGPDKATMLQVYNRISKEA